MLLLISIALGFLAAVLCKGKPIRLCALHGLWLPIAALATMPFMKYFPGTAYWLKAAMTTISYLLLGAFVILNRKYTVPAIFLGLGGISNYLVIAFNNFRMPISVKALTVFQNITAEAVMHQRPNYFIANDGAKFLKLGDVIVLPGVLGFISIGDILLCVGIFLMILLVSRDEYIAISRDEK